MRFPFSEAIKPDYLSAMSTYHDKTMKECQEVFEPDAKKPKTGEETLHGNEKELQLDPPKTENGKR